MIHPEAIRPFPSWPAGLLVLATALLVPACADTLYNTEIVPSPRPVSPRTADQVEVFVISPPARPHINLGLFQILRGFNDHTTRDMIASLRGQAAGLGCDALLVTSIDNQESKYQQQSIQGSCIVYNDAPASHGDGSKASGAPASVATGPTAPNTWRPALITASPAEVRTAPYVVAPLLTRLEAGQRISASSAAANGWRTVMLPDRRIGYLQEAAVRVE